MPNPGKIDDPTEIANNFNEFFTSVAHTIAEEISPTDHPPDFVPTSDDVPLFDLQHDPVTCSEISDAIKSLQQKKR